MVVILLLLTAALINRQQREGLKTWMQEAYAPPVQLDKSESNWGSKKEKKKNMEPYAVLHPGSWAERFCKKNISLQLFWLKVLFQFNLWSYINIHRVMDFSTCHKRCTKKKKSTFSGYILMQGWRCEKRLSVGQACDACRHPRLHVHHIDRTVMCLSFPKRRG